MEKNLSLVFLVIGSILISACAAQPTKVVASREPASEAQVEDPTMVNVISSTRTIASFGTIDVGNKTHSVRASIEMVKAPRDKVQYGYIYFKHSLSPDIAGQITGNSAGSVVSQKFTRAVTKMIKEGVSPEASKVIAETQEKFGQISAMPAEKRNDAIITTLVECRDRLVSIYL